MRASSHERVEHQTCPQDVADRLRLVGGINRFGEPNFRLVWGHDRIVPMHGNWQEFEHCVATLTDKLTGYQESRPVVRLKREVIETRQVPKYLPANCWHLEMWRPPEEYGSPEAWSQAGEEIIGLSTIDTSGPYPERGEYELCYPLTHDGTSGGQPLPLVSEVVTEIVRMIVRGRESFTLQQRKAAIEQRLRRADDDFVRRTEDLFKDGLRPFKNEEFVTKVSGEKGETS